MSAPVFLAEPGSLDGATPGGHVLLTGAEARHAVSVRRLRAGESVELVDGAGTRVRGAVATIAAAELHIRVEDVDQERAPIVRLTLVQALAKGGRDEQAVESSTEIGIDAVVPWQSERCVSVWAGTRAARGRERWEAVARAAAKQSRRARLPLIEPLVMRDELVTRVAAVVDAGGAAVVLHESADQPLDSAALPGSGAAPATATTEVLIVVGPEGGLSPAEVGALAEAGADVVRLGPHVLRTSTAGPVAVAVLAQRLGRWD